MTDDEIDEKIERYSKIVLIILCIVLIVLFGFRKPDSNNFVARFIRKISTKIEKNEKENTVELEKPTSKDKEEVDTLSDVIVLKKYCVKNGKDSEHFFVTAIKGTKYSTCKISKMQFDSLKCTEHIL